MLVEDLIRQLEAPERDFDFPGLLQRVRGRADAVPEWAARPAIRREPA